MQREGQGNPNPILEPYRTKFRQDYQRLLHSPSFRRLQGKTQLFPSEEHDFYRTRLTHSLEVAQVAHSIATKLNHTHPYFSARPANKIDTDIVEFAGLAHDLGHPPFGHNGEYVLDELMIDSGGFEGNAQTLRILSRLEKKATDEYPPTRGFTEKDDIRRGLSVTFRGLASVLKYDRLIPVLKSQRTPDEKEKPIKGYYQSEHDLVEQIKHAVGKPAKGKFKTIECSIMDVADDIAYSTYDIEDAFAAKFLNPLSILSVSDDLKATIVEKVQHKIDEEYKELSVLERHFSIDAMNQSLEQVFATVIGVDQNVFKRAWQAEELGAAIGGKVFRSSELIARSPYQRTAFTSDLIGRFINGIEVDDRRSDNPVFWQVRPKVGIFAIIETLKMISYTQLIESDKFLAERRRAKHIISRIFDALNESGSNLMTRDWTVVYNHYRHNPTQRKRAVCDFIAGMTNRYCIEFYERLFGIIPPSIHKP